MRGRAIAIGGAVLIVAVLAIVWLIVPWGADSGGRTDRIIEVYGHQMGLSSDEAEQVRDQALDAAEVICSTAPGQLDEVVTGDPNSISAAIDMAEAACPAVAAEFRAAQSSDEPTTASYCDLVARALEVQGEVGSQGPTPEQQERLLHLIRRLSSEAPADLTEMHGVLFELPADASDQERVDLMTEYAEAVTEWTETNCN